MMPEIKWTPEQRQAIETVDRDVLVSAAAGSGKTAVLAERCAYLVADAPSPFRCDVDRLLVVTFTDLSAAEMRRRIHKSLKARHEAAPGDDRLRTQVALVETAQISTLHSFCMWIVRRWFHRAGIDATAPILGEDEIRLLRQDVLDNTFERIYSGTDKFAVEFRALVEDYGLGSDGGIKAFVRRLSEFLDSIPDPEDWLARAEDASPQRVEGIIDETQNALRLELNRQRAYCEETVNSVSGGWPASGFYRELIEQYAAKVTDWHRRLDHRGAFEQVRSDIEGFELSSKGVPRTSKNAAPEEIDAKDQGKQAFEFVRSTLFAKRLKIRFGRFTTDEMAAGIAKTLPYVATLAELVRRFRRQYQLAKRDMGVMDFSDLERIAYDLLTESNSDEPVNPVVTELRQRFVHVLVDEFQDINPLQAKILSLVSRPIDAASNGNCFTVGDVKQSIYRFRLAEPNMFLDRARTLADDRTPGMCIDLQHNYRSTSAILEGVNLLFGALMSAECGGIEYDERAKLKAPQSDSSQGEPIELHILERGINVSEDDALAQVDASDPTQWTSIEREAVLVGRRIRELIDGGFAVTEDGIERPLRYGDICVLLRSPRHGAGRVAAMLARMGISCWTKQAEDSFGRLEIREMLALLAIIDNVRQDIPLATVLRSGILGERLDEDELVEVRCFKDGVDFHEAVRLYANRGRQTELQSKLSRIFSRVKSYRAQMRERPLADVLGSIYRSTGYLAYVGGLRDGTKRRANLIALHERARQFGQFRRQGLRRFLAYLDLLRERGESLAAPSLGGGEAEDCVNILSIHGAKGLEYPVVIAMEMGRMFNLGDSTGRMLFERQSGIGLRAVDREELIEYPTALHQRCVSETHEASIAEELRVWYVATTRAKQKLILVGTEKLETVERLKVASACVVGKQNPISILSARAPLTWFIRALSANSNAGADLFDVATYNEDDIATFRIDDESTSASSVLFECVAAMQTLPKDEPVNPQPTRAEQVLGRLEFAYPHLAVCSVGAVRSASEKNQPFAAVVGEDDPAHLPRRHIARTDATRSSKPDSDVALERGTAVHAALQHIALDQVGSTGQIANELRRLCELGFLSADQRDLIDEEALAWFLASPLGMQIRQPGADYKREWMFLSSEPISRFDPLVEGGDDDRVLVRGVVDGVLIGEDALEIVDYKTDRVDESQLETRTEQYRRQMALYASATGAVFGKRVTKAHLVFLHPRRIVTLTDVNDRP